MKICFITSEYVSPTRGGVERVTYTLTKELKRKQIEVVVICAKGPITENEKDPDIKVLPQNNETWGKYLSNLLKKENIEIIINQSHESNIFELCKDASKDNDCKLITVMHTDPLSVLKGITDIDVPARFLDNRRNKTISSLTWLFRYPYRYYNRKRFLREKLNRIYIHSDAIVLLSDRFKESFTTIAQLKEKTKLYTISNPIEIFPHKTTIKEKVILYVGRMDFSAKRPDRIVRIWEKLYSNHPDWKCIMVGDGPAKAELINYCETRQIHNIEFIGRTNPLYYYETSAILCVTSTFEGFGLVIAEAQSKGMIPIAYNSYEAIKDLIKDGYTGFLIKPFNQKAYIATLNKLMQNEELRKTCQNNIEHSLNIQRFSKTKIADEWLNLFNRI